MKNWLKNLLFVLFSFIFLGLGMLVAEIFIREKGNPLKDPNFLAQTPVDTVTITNITALDSTQGWVNDTIDLSAPTPQSTETKPVTTKSNKEKEYLVITGMFGQKANANREIKKLKDLGYADAYIFSKSSMNAVSAGHFEKEEAQNVAQTLKNKGFQAIVKHE
ncbi:SPOR domain-containing protein [Arcicella sp. LKC2W]|uniref:SPOR domain-containing protein n=1 Tax=Arcicella sp. LKC2W TaxID=2984198 RepID=UPI002B212579|nr:SPOR domain-containing protein [Arcicella sp. LKC2W]MEA5459301.1 SPOR domain-containing protein [Arcicella sp. LKC2W]